MPQIFRGKGQSFPMTTYQPGYVLQLRAAHRRAVHQTTCKNCGRPTLTGPDDDGALSRPAEVDPDRLTRLGIYQAVTNGAALYVLRRSKVGRELDWLGDWANPDPDTEHVMAAHRCRRAPETQPTPPTPDYTGDPPF